MSDMSGKKKRVLVIDDSAAVRQALSDIIDSHPELEVMATAGDPFHASEKLRTEVPDVITLDIEMPRMDGVTFLRRLMAQHPIPVVVCSSLVGDGSATLAAVIEAGAVDVIAKPALGTSQTLFESSVQIQDTVLAASHARLDRRRPVWPQDRQAVEAAPPSSSGRALIKTTDKIVVIGASTGGTEALRAVLEAQSAFSPPIVIVQHMPEAFTSAFANRLDGLCKITVKEAKAGDRLQRGLALIAPGGKHTVLTSCGANYGVNVRDGPLVSHHRPSVDVLFRSAAKTAGSNAIGIIMTGMGNDGAYGLKEMRDAGATTFGQCAKSCVVYGMPQEAMKIGAVEQELDLNGLTQVITRLAQ